MQQGSGLIDYLRAIRRRWPILVLVTLLVTGTAVGLSLAGDEQYEARATLLLRDEQEEIFGDGDGSSDPDRRFNTDVELIRLGSVAEAVRRRLGLRISSQELLDQISTETSNSSDIVELVVTAADPEAAAVIANAYAQEYVDYRRRSAREGLREAAELARTRLESLSPAERASREGELLAARQRELEIAAALQTGGARLVRPAALPVAPTSPRPVLSAAVGGVLGLLLGALLAVSLEFADRRLRDEDDVEQLFGLPVLATIPHISRRKASERVAAEAHGLLAAHLSLTARRGSRVVMITSPAPGDGKSFTTLGIARALARLGQRVVVVEADLRRPWMQTPPDDIDGPRGLVALLSRGGQHVADELVWVDSSGQALAHDFATELSFVLLPAGGTPRDPQRLLARPEMADVLQHARGLADIVLIDTPPVAVVNDAITLAPHVDSVLLVARMDKTSKDAARDAVRVLRNIDAQLEGVVVNDVRWSDQHDYYGPPRDADDGADVWTSNPGHGAGASAMIDRS